ncbi:uncharacterized protein LOC121889719 [Thunnus maccoyii]|uniref:uncharacterized protein LOC121889719 n=1 Tax=Thunnus maccoyii TaxID=8240 RepID=UPI001C4BD83C|nr:uncharacterized protein LOC121889719 [Thunnus maccoyii]
MVFSSLRSRNRHSANPNPRLHTGASRDTHTHRNTHSDPHMSIHTETKIHDKNKHTRMCSEKEIRNTRWQQDDDSHTLIHAHTPRDGLNSRTNPRHGCRQDTLPQVDSPAPSPHPLSQTLSQEANQDFPLSDLHPQALPPPLLPAHSASSLGSPPSLAPLVVPAPEETERCQDLLALHTNQTPLSPLRGPTPITMTTCNSQSVSSDYGVTKGKCERTCISPLTNQQRWWQSGDPTPKKKPRKSSMPVKIEREKVEGRRNEEEEECFVAFSSA